MHERDDLIINDSYAVAARHSEEHGKEVRKKIIFVTVLLSVITAIEVALGVFIKHHMDIWPVVKWSFIAMTVVKAFYIVSVFMHLGNERSSFKYIVLVPYLIFAIYLIFVGITESNYINSIWQLKP